MYKNNFYIYNNYYIYSGSEVTFFAVEGTLKNVLLMLLMLRFIGDLSGVCKHLRKTMSS